MRNAIDYLLGNLALRCLTFGCFRHISSYFYINATNYDVATLGNGCSAAEKLTYESAYEDPYEFSHWSWFAVHEVADPYGVVDHGYNRGLEGA